MQGRVEQVKRTGVVASLDGAPEVGDLVEVYRVDGGRETVVGRGYVRKTKGPLFKVNPMEDETGAKGPQFPGVREGDLVRGV